MVLSVLVEGSSGMICTWGGEEVRGVEWGGQDDPFGGIEKEEKRGEKKRIALL